MQTARTIHGINLDTFTLAYLTAALWAETDNMDDDGNGGEPLEDNYDLTDIAPSALKKLAEECADFQGMEDWEGKPLAKWLAETGADDEQHGHDFYLTRNGHGAGFWDRGYGPVGDVLSRAAKSYGTSGMYVGDDGQIYTHG